MDNINQNLIEIQLSENIYRLFSLENYDLLILLEFKILIIKKPDYKLQNSVVISINDLKLLEMSLWKNNHILVITKDYLYYVQIYENNNNYKIILKANLYNYINIKFKRFIQIIPLNDYSKFILNSYGKFLIYGYLSNKTFQSEMTFIHIKSFQSFFQIKENEIVCNSETEKKVYFIDLTNGSILSKINNIVTFILDRDIFCLINKNILGMAGDLRNGIYFFDINRRELIYQYKEDWRGYNCILNIGNNKFLGESYEGRSYAESDDEDEEIYCTKFFEYNEKENKIKSYKISNSRTAELKRKNFIKFKDIERIAYEENKTIYLEDL